MRRLALGQPLGGAVDARIAWLVDAAKKIELASNEDFAQTVPIKPVTGLTNVKNVQEALESLVKSIGAFNVLTYDADPTNTVDATTPIQNTITAAVAAGVTRIYIPEGEYRIEGTITNPGVHIFGAGRGKTVLHKIGTGNVFATLNTTFTKASHTLDTNAALGSRAISLSTGEAATFSVGDLCVLIDEGKLDDIVDITSRHAEFCTIQAISGDDITLWGPTRYAYTTANTAQLCATSLLEGVAFSDFTVVMDNTITLTDPNTTWTDASAFRVQGCKGPEWSNIEVRDGVYAALVLVGCFNARVEGYRVLDMGSATTGTDDPSSTEGIGGYGYALVECELNEGLIADSLHIERARHGYDAIVGFAMLGGGLANYGEAIGTIVSNSVHFESKEASWGQHTSGRGLHLHGVRAIRSRTNGFQIRARGTSLIDCSAEDCVAAALWIRGGTSTNARGNQCYVSNFRASRTNQQDGYPGGISWTEKGAIVDDGIDTVIEGAFIEECGGPALEIGMQVSAVTRGLYSNITTLNPCQLASTNTYAVLLTNAASDAELQLDNFRCRSVDGEVTNVVHRAVAGKELKINDLRSEGHTGVLFSSVTDDGFMDNSVTIETSGYPSPQPSPRVTLFDDFLGATLGPWWRTNKGSDAAAALPVIVPAITGRVRLTTGADANGTNIFNASQLTGEINWRAANGGPLFFDTLIRVDAITNIAIYLGFGDQSTALEFPFNLTGSTLTSVVSDGCGVLFDTNATTDTWRLVGVAGDTDATMQNTALAPVAGTFERWRVMISTTGVATFFRNGIAIGTAMTGAVTNSVGLVPIISGVSRSTASRNIDVDWIWLEQRRG